VQAAQQRVASALAKPQFKPGYAARVKAQMQANTAYRERVVQWEKRRNELEGQLGPAVAGEEGGERRMVGRVELLAAWMELMNDDEMRDAVRYHFGLACARRSLIDVALAQVCALWQDPNQLSAAW